MDGSRKNKENKSSGKKITDCFRVKKCLFESNKLDVSPTCMSLSSSSPIGAQESPYALFTIRKRQVFPNNFSECATPSNRASDETPLKRSGAMKQRTREISIVEDVTMESPKSSVRIAVQKSMVTEEGKTLTGDFSKECILPVIRGRHPELSTITSETVASLLINDHGNDYVLIDCRYPYEYTAGHIKNAVNIFSKENVVEDFFSSNVTDGRTKSNRILIFYCEFSSERAPNMMRFIRNTDRGLNEDVYPFVYYPEMYLLEGGYKSFFASFKEFCEPQKYVPMLAKESSAEFVYYRNLCRSSSLRVKKEKLM